MFGKGRIILFPCQGIPYKFKPLVGANPSLCRNYLGISTLNKPMFFLAPTKRLALSQHRDHGGRPTPSHAVKGLATIWLSISLLDTLFNITGTYFTSIHCLDLIISYLPSSIILLEFILWSCVDNIIYFNDPSAAASQTVDRQSTRGIYALIRSVARRHAPRQCRRTLTK